MGMLFPVRLMKNSWLLRPVPHPHPTQDEAPHGPPSSSRPGAKPCPWSGLA